MSAAIEILRDRLAATPLGARGLSFTSEGGDRVALTHEAEPTGVRAAARPVRVPSLAALRVEGRWIELTVDPALLAPDDVPVVIVACDAAGHTAWATRDELLARAPAPSPADAVDERQVRLGAFSGAAGCGLHRMLLVLAAEALRPALTPRDDDRDAGLARARSLLRRFVDEGEGFDATRDEVAALGLPPWFVAAHANASDEATLSFATPPYFERLAIELEGHAEAVAVRECTLRCARAGALRATWVNDVHPSPVGLTLRLDLARNTLELRASLRGVATSAARLAPAARFVWRLAQGGRLALVPACSATGVTAGAAFAAQADDALDAALIETLDALAAIELGGGLAFEVTPAALADAATAEAVRELLAVRASGRVDRAAAAMRLSLTGAEVARLLDAAGGQRRITFRTPPARAQRTVLGASVSLGQRVQEITGTLSTPATALRRALATMAPADPIDLELSAVEVRELYASAAPGAPTTGAPATRGAPSGTRSGST